MNRRLLLGLGASALIVLGALPGAAFAAGPSRPTHKTDLAKIDPTIRPKILEAQTPTAVDVVLELDGTAATGPGMTRAAQRTRAATLATTQSGLAAAVARHGARVTARYRYVYNGLRVRTTTDRLAELAALPGVLSIRPVRVYQRTNTNGVPFVGGPATWATGATGAGVTIAVLDTGIDYTHANFGGAGTAAAFTANDGTVVEPDSFPTAKVIAGTDLAGDAYDASADDAAARTPHPDPDPLDCDGHGSHVAGTAAGQGVLANHATYSGSYAADTIAAQSWTIGPGVAPEASLVALRVFGCEGSTDLVVEALEWVGHYNADHADPIDIVNLSLGSPFGSGSDPDIAAINALVAAGVTVVAAAGNEGAVSYISGTPATATQAISVAALDALPTEPLAEVQLPGGNLDAINQNAYPGLPVSGTLHVLAGGSTVIKEGCDAEDFDHASVGKIVAVRRGTCPFVDKGRLAQAAGAIGVVVVNKDGLDVTDDELPALIGYNPEIFDIPMAGVARAGLAAVVASNGLAVTIASAGTRANPAYRQVADFSSSGPRWGDSRLKPDVAAPGASVLSTAVGSGYKGTTLSGTSMASPLTAGAAALVIEAHPDWTPLRVKAALSNTADAASVDGYSVLRSGSGVIRVDRAASVNVTATTSDGTASLSYGYVVPGGAWSAARTITFTNDGDAPATFSLTSSSALVRLSAASITIAPHASGTVTATAALTAAQTKALCSVDPWASNGCNGLNTRTGAITATPVDPVAGQLALRVPYLIVPRGASAVAAWRGSRWTRSNGKISGTLKFANPGGHAGFADVYALGVTDKSHDARIGRALVPTAGTDVRATGVQVLPAAALWDGLSTGDRALFFAVNMHDRFSTAAPHEVDVAVDTNADGRTDYIVFGQDLGYLVDGFASGEWVSLVYDVRLEAITDLWPADAPYNGSTVILAATASDLHLGKTHGRFTYRVVSYDGITGAVDGTARSGAFNAYAPRQSSGQLRLVGKGSSASAGAWFYRVSGVRGWLVVTMDDRNGSSQANVVALPSRP